MVPSPEALMENMIPNYITGFVYSALVEVLCSEQNARMMAMQSATDNASADSYMNWSIEYNRVRQAAITQEITEVSAVQRHRKRKNYKEVS